MQIATASWYCSHANDTFVLCHSMQRHLFHASSLYFSIHLHRCNQKHSFVLPSPPDLIYNNMASFFSPFYSLLTLTSESYHHGQETKDNAPSQIAYSSIVLLKKLGLCFLSAAYVCMILFLVLILASVVGVGLVRFWVEEPLIVHESLHFDYTESHPTAVFSFTGGVSAVGGYIKKKHIRVPVGHTFSVSLSLLMPESDFNRELGVFQLTAELLSVNGNVIAKSSQPCMLRFRSSPIRLARTVMMGVPLILGISAETQNINVEILRHKEVNQRTSAVRVTLHPRAGTSSLPQLYEAELVLNSHLPWTKELLRNWKWALYVWVSLYVYVLLLMILLCFYRPFIFLVTPESFSSHRVSEGVTSAELRELQDGELSGDESDVSELLRKLRLSRSKRKTILTHGGVGVEEAVGSSASSISMSATREDVTSTVVEDVTSTVVEDVTSVDVEDDVEDSESVCID